MNRIPAKVIGIESSENLQRLSLSSGKRVFTVITLEPAEEYTVGSHAEIRFKPAHVALAKEMSGEVSIANRLESIVLEMQKGRILVDMLLESFPDRFYALTTVEAVERMGLAPGDKITALIKASDLYLVKPGMP